MKRDDGSTVFAVYNNGVQIYVDDSGTKGAKGGFAVGGFGAAKGLVSNFLDLTPENYFIGHKAGISNTTGMYNSFFGYKSGYHNTTGNQNLFLRIWFRIFQRGWNQ